MRSILYNRREATKQLPDNLKQKYPQIPWKEMAGMSDRLIHFYLKRNRIVYPHG
ncbi:MAG: DUF86 domain-containing protein [Candidatus Omnitrophica bacterium]|nr:DUF86 domain-containing protein [Candidatus Omnitrophota bacterium]